MREGFKTAELDRMTANLIRFGAVKEVDYAAAKVRVEIGELLTAWLPWLTHRAGGNISWHAPEIGEQVIVLSPSGDMTQGVVLMAVYQTAYPANASSADIHRMDYGNGDFFEYNRAGGHLHIQITGNLTINAGGIVTITGSTINLN
jgi:phage baseplate assembly protein V